MNLIKNSRYTDKREEIIFSLMIAFLPLATLAGMVH